MSYDREVLGLKVCHNIWRNSEVFTFPYCLQVEPVVLEFYRGSFSDVYFSLSLECVQWDDFKKSKLRITRQLQKWAKALDKLAFSISLHGIKNKREKRKEEKIGDLISSAVNSVVFTDLSYLREIPSNN